MASAVPLLHLDVLPEPQRKLWFELNDTPTDFILYGGTAIALQLGHRISVDFDFFTAKPFCPNEVLHQTRYLQHANILQQNARTLTCLVDRGGPVKVSYYHLPKLKAITPAIQLNNPAISIASLQDLGATKTLTVQQRAELKDYLDIDALIQAGLSLDLLLASAIAIYDPQFNPELTLKALSYFGDEEILDLSPAHRGRILSAVKSTDLDKLPVISWNRDPYA